MIQFPVRRARFFIGTILWTATLLAASGAIDWQADYAIPPGFRVQRDSTGFELPSAIAFVPHPGQGPKDPLYFVTELRGKLKVVTNDRSVMTFAEGFDTLVPHEELPSHLGEIGMAGICLEPEHGYIFVSYAYEDKDGIYRNAIMRFDTQPQVFAVKPSGQKRIAMVLDKFVSNLAHQIGPLTVLDGNLFANVGDGLSGIHARDLTFAGGKILRMTLDGLPLRDNPFAKDGDPNNIQNYVWALGFRNPFSLWAVKGRLFAAENGLDIDRFVEVKRGADYLYDGEADASGANALFTWSPAVGPVQLAYDNIGDGTAGFPEEWKNQFFLALAGSPTDPPGPDHRRKSLVSIGFDFENNRLSQIPHPFLRYVGAKRQLIVGVAAGHDGIYVVPMFQDAEGATAVLRLDYHPDTSRPVTVIKPLTADQIIASKSCIACHKIDGQGLGTVAPLLSRLTLTDQILRKIDTPEYAEQLRKIDALTSEPFIRFRAARDEIRNAVGVEKARLWIKYRVLEPKFDRTVAAMPNLGLTTQEAETVSSWLVEPSMMEDLKLHLHPVLGNDLKKRAKIFGLGAFSGALLTLAITALWIFVRSRKK
ncbi:MAG TPA: PQQ-dependent sugar dehydrogenase [Lacunisphaera sp.]